MIYYKMLPNKFIIVLLLMGLQCCNTAAESIQMVDMVDYNEGLSTFQGATLVLFSIAIENNLTVPPSCVKSYSCVLNFLLDKNVSTVARFFIRQPEIAPPPPPSLEDINFNETNNTNGSTVDSSALNAFKYSDCGVYPACSVRYLTENLYNLTCSRPLMVFAAIMGIVVAIVIILSNVVIIIVTLRTRSLRKPHGFFKLSLAVADLIAGVFILPSIAHNTLNSIDYEKLLYNGSEIASLPNVGDTNSSSAIFFGVMGILSTITAVYSLLLLSIDSFISVRWPMKYRIGDIMNSKRAVVAVLTIWLFSICVAFLPVLAEEILEYGLAFYSFMYVPIIKPLPGTTSDTPVVERYLHAVLYTILVWGIPFFVTWVLTILTSIQSRKMLKNMREARRRSVRSERNLNKVDRELTRTVAIILTLFTITILPVFGVTLAVAISPQDSCTGNSIAIAFFAATYIFIAGRFLNVIIYNLFNKEFRTASKKFLDDLLEFICCYRRSELGLPKSSYGGKKSSDTWTSKKSKDKWDSKDTRDTGVSARTASASTTITTADKGLLTPGATSSKLSNSSINEETGQISPSPSSVVGNNSVFTLETSTK